MRGNGALVAGAMLSLAVSGCSTADDGERPEPSFGTVTELRDALVDEGFRCPDWVQDDTVETATESGSCTGGDEDKLMVFATDAHLKEQLEVMDEARAKLEELGLKEGVRVAGDRWLVFLWDADDAVKVAGALGGKIVPY